MKLINALKKIKWGYLFISLVLCASGVCFLVFPEETVKTSSYIISACSLLVGITVGIKFLIDKGRGFTFGIAMCAAACTVICGIVGLIIPERVFSVYPMFIGLFFIMDGSFKLQTVISAKRYRLKMWWFLLSFSVLTIIGGFLMIRLKIDSDIKIKAFVIIMAIAFILSGIENFLSLFFLGKITKRAKEELLEELDDESEEEGPIIATEEPKADTEESKAASVEVEYAKDVPIYEIIEEPIL